MKTREAAYFAVLYAVQEKGFIFEFLEEWNNRHAPSSKDFGLAREIAYGTMRRQLSLKYIAEQLSPSLNLKAKEKQLLFTALYQLYFMDRIPVYAIVNETVNIAKKHFHARKVAFLNAVLRKSQKVKLPSGDTANDLSTKYSSPPFLVEQFINQYGLAQAKEIMSAMNMASKTTARQRSQNKMHIIDNNEISKIIASTDYYIQNFTPATLINKLCEKIAPPKNVLDLCAAPGGKTILIHDNFPNAKLYANDVSPAKLALLKENFQKYGLDVQISCSRGEEFTSEEKFDLIIIDAPCSNSGVLNKRPEARWRISQNTLDELTKIQKELIQNAQNLLSPSGEIWYLTCSILAQENENLIQQACQNNLQTKNTIKLLPNEQGYDGGFAIALTKTQK